jgi:uncharacterized protein YhbP (UPF0306 family)
MSKPLEEKTISYLESHNVMTLATNGPEGLWAAAVFYASYGFELYFLSAPTTRHSRNIAANPHVAVTIQEDYKDWLAIRGVQLEGECRQLDGESRSTAIERYEAKFPIIGPDAPSQIARSGASRRGSTLMLKRLIVGMSGASGVIYGIRMMEVLQEVQDVETHLVMSPAAKRTIVLETDRQVSAVEALADKVHNFGDIAAPLPDPIRRRGWWLFPVP